MASTFTNNLRFNKQSKGDNSGTWGVVLNLQLDLIEDAISGVQSLTLVDGDNLLTQVNGDIDTSRPKTLVVSGELTTAATIIAPDTEFVKVVANKTIGDKVVTFRTSSGTGVVVPSSSAMIVYSDGASVYPAAPAANVDGSTFISSSVSVTNLNAVQVSASKGNFYNLTVPSNASIGSLYVSGGANIGTQLNAQQVFTSTARVNGVASVGSLVASGDVSAANVRVTGVYCGGIQCSGGAAINGGLTVGALNTGNLNASGTASIGGSLYVGGGIAATNTISTPAVVTSTLTVTNPPSWAPKVFGTFIGSGSTVSIQNSYAVASVSVSGSGTVFTVTFSTPLASNRYTVLCNAESISTTPYVYVITSLKATNKCVFRTDSAYPINFAII